ncbi:Holliday junction resolvase RuvX [Fulvivirga sediminis]|uniref:Putative pre-16S rRNA nuclease n=1 Tax=Fulvivirga sediminis TaxID=2803949 RepID=A0A937F8Q6_9BACT|nr:Holliday junction resolvase RuvX [Fulvivirga sediminis]MBL3657082.1 Holliday junction resolvase RuvX [Fulvivirga sediminis]
MGRIIAIDFGTKRVGLAATDPLKIIASPLTTVPTKEIISFLKEYSSNEEVEKFVIGMPKNLQNEDTDATSHVKKFIEKLQKNFSNIPIHEVDERFTSKIATDSLLSGGMKKKDRRQKGNIDKVSAALILQSYLDSPASF